MNQIPAEFVQVKEHQGLVINQDSEKARERKYGGCKKTMKEREEGVEEIEMDEEAEAAAQERNLTEEF